MEIQLSDHFTYKKLFWFTMPPIMMMIFTSIYSVVDGYFVSNYIAKLSLLLLILYFLKNVRAKTTAKIQYAVFAYRRRNTCSRCNSAIPILEKTKI